MKMPFTALMGLVLYSSAWSLAPAPAGGSAVLGTWEGESKCTVPDSPCHDEHVIYQIMAAKDSPDKVRVDAYKVVDRREIFMGTLDFVCRAGMPLSCTCDTPRQDRWEFQVSGDSMTGTLTIDNGKTLYRKITLRKK